MSELPQRTVVMDPAIQKVVESLTLAVESQCMEPPATDFKLAHFVIVALPVNHDLQPSNDIMPGVITTFGFNPAAMMHAALMLMELAGRGEYQEFQNVQH